MPLVYLPNLERLQIWLAHFELPYSIPLLAAGATASIFLYIAYKALYLMIIRPYFFVLKDLPGPEKLDSYCELHDWDS